MNNRKYIIFGLLACVALLFFAHSNTYAVQNNLAAKGKGVAIDRLPDDIYKRTPSDKGVAIDRLPDDIYRTAPSDKGNSLVNKWISYLRDLWYKAVLQDK